MTDRSIPVQAALQAGELDAVLVVAPPNVAYVCGFHAEPHERLIALVVPRQGEPRLVCPSLEEDAARSAVDGRVALHVWRDEEGPADALARALAGTGPRLGIEKRYLTVGYAELVAATARAAALTACDDVLGRLRAVKSEDEIDAIHRAARIVDRVVGQLGELAAPGITEAACSGSAPRAAAHSRSTR